MLCVYHWCIYSFCKVSCSRMEYETILPMLSSTASWSIEGTGGRKWKQRVGKSTNLGRKFCDHYERGNQGLTYLRELNQAHTQQEQGLLNKALYYSRLGIRVSTLSKYVWEKCFSLFLLFSSFLSGRSTTTMSAVRQPSFETHTTLKWSRIK